MFTATENTSDVWTRTESAQDPTVQTPVSMDLRVPRYCVLGPIFLFSVTGNMLVILTVVLLRKMKTVPMIFIANLAACDLTTTVSSIAFDLPVLELGYWPYGAALCKIIWPLATFSTNAAALTLVAISIDRYISIICPLNMKCRITKGKCFRIIAGIYCVSAVAVAPYIVILKYNDNARSCDEDWPNGYNLDKVYTVVLFVLQYGLPLIVMSVVYTRIGLKLCKNTGKASELSAGKTNRARSSTTDTTSSLHSADKAHSPDKAANSLLKRKRLNEKTAKMLLCVVVVFLIFMMPHQLLWLSYDYASNTEGFKQKEDLIVFICQAFTYANSVLNAIIYGVLNGNFRRGFLSIIKCQCSKARQRNQARQVKRSETMFSANYRGRQESDVSSGGVRDNSARTNVDFAMRKEAMVRNSHAIANEIKSSKTNGTVSNKPLSKNFMARGESPKNASLYTNNNDGKIRNGESSAKLDTHKSLYDNDVFHFAPESDTLYWVSETEALLNRICRELDTTAGEKGVLSEQQRGEISLPKAKDKYLFRPQPCDGKETIL